MLTIVLLCLQQFPAGAETLLYGDIRAAIQVADSASQSTGPNNYASRVGARVLYPVATLGEGSSVLAHVEFGFLRDKLDLNGTRLLLAGIRGPLGQLTVGKQWSAFYSAVGRFMDVGFVQSGFGYEGSNRIKETLQYSRLFGQTYVQADAVHDENKRGNGLNRFQLGLAYQGAVWRGGLAFDVSRLGQARNNTLSAAREDDRSLCDRPGVACVGASLGWAVAPVSVDVGAVRATATGADATGASLTVRWAPNEFSHYVELAGQNQPQGLRRSIAAGLRYRHDQFVSLFAELARVDRRRFNSAVDHVVGVGLRLELDRRF